MERRADIEDILSSCFDELSRREGRVLYLVSKGYSNKEIGKRLGISEYTVANHIKSIFPKIGKTNRIAAALYAIRKLRSRKLQKRTREK
jgi:RNA polymerase sigma factor (sigma-70 family)